MRKKTFYEKSTGLRKIFRNFWINGSSMQFCYCKRKFGRSRNEAHVPRQCTKQYPGYIPHIKYPQEIYRTKPGRHMAKYNVRSELTKKIKYQGERFISSKMKTSNKTGIT